MHFVLLLFSGGKEIYASKRWYVDCRRDYKGNVVPGRTTGPPCKCKAKCFEEVEPELRYHVLMSFNSLADKCQQDQYLSGLVVGEDPTWVGTQGRGGKFSETNQGRKKVTYKYFIATGKLI